LEEVQRASQFLHNQLPPHYNPKDARHVENAEIMFYKIWQDKKNTEQEQEEALKQLELLTFKDRANFANFESEEFGAERTGVTHLVHTWYPKGHSVCKQWSSILLSLLILPKDRMVPSKDFLRSGQGAQAVLKYLTDTQRTSAKLAGMFQAAFPEYYEKYKTAFLAGCWAEEDKGPWIGRAIVWKLQVGLHRDALDEGPAACFPCGNYKGGQLCLPDLDAKLE